MSNLDASLDALYAGVARTEPREDGEPDVPVWRNGRVLEPWEAEIYRDAIKAERKSNGEIVRGVGRKAA